MIAMQHWTYDLNWVCPV